MVDHAAHSRSDAGEWNIRRVFEVALGVPATDGNDINVLRNGDRIFPAMLDAIRAAERSIDFLTFVYWTGDIAVEFSEALAERAATGVRVRILLDAVGARRIRDDLVEAMSEAGCTVEMFRPVDDVELGEVVHRTHRKVLVCDEQVGFTGGVGIAEEWTGDARGPDEWRDTHFQIRGPAVDGLRAAFLEDWSETGHPLFEPGVDRLAELEESGSSTVQIIGDGDRTGHSATSLAFGLLLAGAQESVRITTAYFTPDDSMLERIIDAAARGVKVEILVPGEHADKQFVRFAGEELYERLLDAGVSVCVYQPSMLHAKIMIADGQVAVVGSSNINSRSLSEDDEIIMTIFDTDIVEELEQDFKDDLGSAVALDPADWAERGLLRRVGERLSAAASDLL